jgi:DNA-binding LytR/AlgR family response regulator
MIKAIALDDEPLALKIIETFCADIEFIDLEKTFSKPNEALKYINKFPVDLIFLDIQMPSINGIDFYKNLDKNVMVIFTTAFPEYAVDGFELNAVDYLMKPFSFERFMQSVNKAKEYFNFINSSSSEIAQNHFFIRADYKLIKVMYDDIVYIEGLNDYVKIFLLNQKPIIARITMKSMLDRLPQDSFIRVHRSYIVSKNKVVSLKNKNLFINFNDEMIEISIGKSYEDCIDSILK